MPVRFTRGARRRIIREYTSERGVRQFTRCLQAVCRKVTLGLDTGDASLVRDPVTARHVRAFLGAPVVDPADGLDRVHERLDAPALPPAVRVRGRQVLERLSAWATTDPDHARAREYLHCLLSLPWTARTAAPSDLARAGALLDTEHAAHEVAKERLLDYVAVRLAKPDVPAPLLCLAGPAGAGKTTLARLVAAALGRECAWVYCGALSGPAALCGARSGPARPTNSSTRNQESKAPREEPDNQGHAKQRGQHARRHGPPARDTRTARLRRRRRGPDDDACRHVRGSSRPSARTKSRHRRGTREPLSRRRWTRTPACVRIGGR